MLCYMAITPAVRQTPALRKGWRRSGGAPWKRKRTVVTVVRSGPVPPPPPHLTSSAGDDDDEEEEVEVEVVAEEDK